jgi:hypothetical protein
MRPPYDPTEASSPLEEEEVTEAQPAEQQAGGGEEPVDRGEVWWLPEQLPDVTYSPTSEDEGVSPQYFPPPEGVPLERHFAPLEQGHCVVVMGTGDLAAVRASVTRPLEEHQGSRDDFRLEVYPSELVIAVVRRREQLRPIDQEEAEREAFRVARVLASTQLPSTGGTTRWMARRESGYDYYSLHLVPVCPVPTLTWWSTIAEHSHVFYMEHRALPGRVEVPSMAPASPEPERM